MSTAMSAEIEVRPPLLAAARLVVVRPMAGGGGHSGGNNEEVVLTGTSGGLGLAVRRSGEGQVPAQSAPGTSYDKGAVSSSSQSSAPSAKRRRSSLRHSRVGAGLFELGDHRLREGAQPLGRGSAERRLRSRHPSHRHNTEYEPVEPACESCPRPPSRSWRRATPRARSADQLRDPSTAVAP